MIRRRARSRASVQPEGAGRLSGAQVALRLSGKLYRYGYACVSFGKPVSLRHYVTERGIDFRMLDETTASPRSSGSARC